MAFWGCAGDETPNAEANNGYDVGLDFGGSVQDMGVDVIDSPDVGTDRDVEADVSPVDMDTPDARNDAASADMSMATPGFGTLGGDCGNIDMTEIQSSQAFTFINTLDFGDNPYDDTDFGLLTAGGQEIINDGNAGGSSILSEVFAYEVLERCEMATLLKTETEIAYDTQGKITDLLVRIDGLKVGVSVTRALSFPRDSPYSEMTATNLFEKKLGDILLSTANVSAPDAWEKQILHVLVDRAEHIPVIESVLANVDPMVRADTIVVLTITQGADDPIY